MATIPYDYAPAAAQGTAGVGSGATVSVAVPWACTHDTPLEVEVVSLATGAIHALVEDGEPAAEGEQRYARVLDEDGNVTSVTASNWFGAAVPINAYVRRAIVPAQEWSPRSTSGANLRTLEASLNELAKSVQQVHAEVFGNDGEGWGGGVVRADDAVRLAPAEVRAGRFLRFDASGAPTYDNSITQEMLDRIDALGTLAFEDAEGVELDILPGANQARDLGSAGLQWDNVFADDMWATNVNFADSLYGGTGKVQLRAGGVSHVDDLLAVNLAAEGGSLVEMLRIKAAHGTDADRVTFAATPDIVGIGRAYAVELHASEKVRTSSGKTYMVGGSVNHTGDILAWYIANTVGDEYEGMRLIDTEGEGAELAFNSGGRIAVRGASHATTLDFADPGAFDRTITFPAASGTVALTTDTHAPVTLSADAENNLLGLSGQQITLDSQTANKVLAGPSAGGAAAPGFRALADADIPDALTIAGGTIDGTPIGGSTPSTGSFTALSTSDGTASAPAMSFLADPDTGIYRMGTNGLAFATAGTRKFFAADSYVTFDVQTFAVSGSATFPGWAFAADANTGIYRVSEDRIGFSTGASLAFSIETSGVTITNQCVGKTGTAGSPSYAFTGDGNTGWFSAAADQIAGACGGTQSFLLTSTGINNTAIGATTPGTGRFTTMATTATSTSYSSPALALQLPNSSGATLLRAEDSYTSFGAGFNLISVGKGSGVGSSEFASHTISLLQVYGDNTGTASIASIDVLPSYSGQIGAGITFRTRSSGGGSSASRLGIANDGVVSLPSATSAASALVFGATDTANLYRSAADTLKTDDSLVVGSRLFIGDVAPGIADLPLYYDTSNGAVTTGGIACPAVFVDGEPVGEILVAGDPYSALNVREGLLKLGRLSAGVHVVEVINLKDFRDHVRSVSFHAVEAGAGITAMRPLAWDGPATLADGGDTFVTLAKGEGFALSIALDEETDVAMRATGFYEAREQVWSGRRLAELAGLRHALSA